MLSKYEPIGAMVYGGAEFMGIPWESILKSYRSELGSSRFGTLDEYAAHFIDYLRCNEILFPTERQQVFLASVLNGFLRELRSRFVDDVKDRIAKSRAGTNFTETDILNALDDFLEACATALEKIPFLEDNNLQAIVPTVREIAKDILHDVFEEFPLNENREQRILDLCVDRILRDYWGNTFTGIVFAGFGDTQVFPAIRDYMVELSFDKVVRCKLNENGSSDVTDENTACITPFAQGDMVRAFMEGSDPSYRDYAEGQLDKLFEGIPARLVEKLNQVGLVSDDIGNEFLAAFQTDVKELLDRFKGELNAFQQDHFVQKTMNVVSVLPKEELAEMAETLVSLTSFKRRMSMDVETVGGPVDVAVISKGDGFIWVKRKHYFQPELNHGFFSKYFLKTDTQFDT